MTPEQLFAQLMTELSASGGFPINNKTNDNPNASDVTLREAIAALYWKQTAAVNLAAVGEPHPRPLPPTQIDDMLGHILSMRVEGLQNQALLAALCEAAHIDVPTILAQVQESLRGA
jgi:hypothetical protein